MNTKFDEMNVIEAYEKPSMKIYEMETETVLMQGASGIKSGNGPIEGDGGMEDGHKGPPGQEGRSRSTLPKRNTRPYMGNPE